MMPPGQEAAVREQHISLKIDAAKQQLEGYTELKIDVIECQTSVALHATNLDVTAVTVDGCPAQFSFVELPSVQDAMETDDQTAATEVTAEAVAESVAQQYAVTLQAAATPQLVVTLPSPSPPTPTGDSITTLTIRITYSAAQQTNLSISSNSGVSFWDGRYAVADTDMPSAWVPCGAISGSTTTTTTIFSLDLTVPAAHVAVGPGKLVKQAWADPERRWRTFFYLVSLPCSPADLGFAVGPFETTPLPATAGIECVMTHFVPASADRPPKCDVEATTSFLALPFELFESPDALNSRFPLPALQQVFVPPEVARSSISTYIGLQILTTDLLLVPTSVEQSQEARCAGAGALARQWFGHYVVPATGDDAWLVDGLAAWLEEQYIRRFMGKTEAAYRRWRRRQTLVTGDGTGEAPPLALRGVDMLGSERLEPSPLRQIKAAAVVAMLERRAGGDLFKRQVEALVTQQQGQQRRGADAPSFVENLAKATDFKNEWKALLERWVYGRGVPQLTLGFRFHRRGCYLEVGIQQRGSRASLAGALAAEKLASLAQASTGVIKVVVREGSGATADHPVHVGAEALVAAELRVNPEVKKVQRKRGRKRKDEEERAAELAAAVENMQHPVQWVRLDPGGEWLCGVRVLQPERTLCNQLRDSKDVVAQSEAVRGLAELPVTEYTQGPLNTLKDALADVHLACRVRCEAANALASLRDENGRPAGLRALLSYYNSRYWEDEEAVKPVTFSSIDDYLVAQAVVSAVANCARLAEEDDAFEAVALLLKGAQCYQSAWGAFDDSGLLASLLRGLGVLRLPVDTEIEAVEYFAGQAHDVLRRYLERELIAPSPWSVVGRAALAGLADLLVGLSGRLPRDSLRETISLVKMCVVQRDLPMRLRDAAVGALVRLSSSGALSVALWCLENQRELLLSPQLVTSAWQEAAKVCGGSSSSTADIQKALALVRNVSMEPRLRHLVFVTLRRMGRLPPTLFVPPASEAALLEEAHLREVEDNETRIKLSAAVPPAVPGVGPSPLSGIVKFKPAVSQGGAMSVGGGAAASEGGVAGTAAAAPAPLKLKVKVKLPGGGSGSGAGQQQQQQQSPE